MNTHETNAHFEASLLATGARLVTPADAATALIPRAGQGGSNLGDWLLAAKAGQTDESGRAVLHG